jgi:hypothetical protein
VDVTKEIEKEMRAHTAIVTLLEAYCDYWPAKGHGH